MIPYCRHEVREEDRDAVDAVLRSAWLTQGPALEQFEAALCLQTDAQAAVAVSSGTSALWIALQALGVGPGDEVIVPSLTFIATANAVLLCGARPVFADIDPDSLSLDPAELARLVGPKTRGAILVHYAGHVGDVAGCRAALGEGRFLLEDACHALGAVDRGARVGAQADAACFSFHPAKHISTGEGGAITTNDASLAERCRSLRSHGVERRASAFRGLGLPAELVAEEEGGWVYEMHSLASNHRLSDMSAGLGTSQLGRLEEILEERRQISACYAEAFEKDERVRLLPERTGTQSAWHLYPVRLDRSVLRHGRAGVYKRLHADSVGVQIHYIPVHLQPYYRSLLGTQFGDLPATEAAYLELLSLPLFPGLPRADQARVIECVSDALDAEAV